MQCKLIDMNFISLSINPTSEKKSLTSFNRSISRMSELGLYICRTLREKKGESIYFKNIKTW